MHTVILVDDEVFVRIGLRNLIDWNSLGYDIIDEADNGEDALELIERKKPDLVVTDIRMPAVDGLELIGRARSAQSNACFIIISGYNDFGYAQKAVRYGVHDFILKPIDERELTDALTQLHRKIAENKLFDLRNGDLRKERIVDALIRGDFEDEQLEEWAKELKVDRAKEIHYAFLEVNDVHPWNAPEPPSAEQWREIIRRRIVEAGFAEAEDDAFLKEHHGRFGLLIACGEASGPRGDAAAYAAKLRQAVSDAVGAVVYLYLGRPVSRLAELRDSYLSAKDALQLKFARPDSQVIYCPDPGEGSANYVVADDAFRRQLMESIEEKDAARIAEQVEATFREFKERRFAPEAVKSAIRQVVAGVLTLIRSMEGDDRALTTLEPIVGWQDLNVSPGELKRLFLNFVLESAEEIARLRKDCVKGGIQKIKTYIEAHYNENISLKSIASIFFMNPVYLGQLFKKTYGVHFNEFLLQIRIGEAKKLLRQTDLRVYEIAEKVGFGSADYFVTRFEKLERMTPTEYRNKLLEKK
ncbi:response regulator transcription factor [Paenibacillus sp.]|uniref:response regulator transcription factor n=1 Tax=Paenibacillus sp. TaxID=58172 RepID=UPI0028111968|nr:response regulator transcription factor [Paenibacillus sp.]